MSETPPDPDQALIAAAFALIAEAGWSRLTVADAARRVPLDLAAMRVRFPSRLAILQRFNEAADRQALTGVLTEGPARDRLFDIVMRRIDALQAHRAGVLALLRDIVRDPRVVLSLAPASAVSAAWMLDGAGIPSTGLRGALRVNGMIAVWLATLRAWQKDESEDLSATMAALDNALNRAAQAEASLAEMFGAAPVETTSSIDLA